MDVLNTLGLTMALLGGAIAAILTGIGSAKGVGMVGEAAAGVLTEDPSKFSKMIVLQLLPGTQGLYGLLYAILMLNNIGILGGSAETLSFAQGCAYFAASLPIAIVGFLSAIAQAKASVGGVALVAKKPDHNAKAMTISALVETYAILALLISIIIMVNL